MEKSRRAPIINNKSLLSKFSNLTKKDVHNKNFSAFVKLTDLEEKVGRPMKKTESFHDLFDENSSFNSCLIITRSCFYLVKFIS